MTPEITSAIALLKAKAIEIGKTCDDHHRDHFMVGFPKRLDRITELLGDTGPTVGELGQLDVTELETRLRYAVPKPQQQAIRAKLFAEFGRSTVGQRFEDVAERILERGSVANMEEFETVEPFVWTNCQYGIAELGEANARRLSGLLESFRNGAQ